MNTQQQKTLHFANRATIAVAVLTAMLGSNATVLAGPPSSDSKSAQISLADLDLSTADGRNAAYERLHQAARNLCYRVEQDNDLSRQSNFVACVDLAMAQALPSLQRLAARTEAMHLASSPQR
jgi:UrcA family protein